MNEPIDNSVSRVEFTERRRLLLRELMAKNPILSKMYEGAIFVLTQEDNPDRVALGAHGIREMMRELPKFVDTPIIQKQVGLKKLVLEFKENWDDEASSDCLLKDAPWDKKIVEYIKTLISACKQLFINAEDILINKEDAARAVIRHHNFNSTPLPMEIENQRIKEWSDYLGYFDKVAHHSNSAKTSFYYQLDSFELYLLEWFRPPVFESQQKIASFIEEVERND